MRARCSVAAHGILPFPTAPQPGQNSLFAQTLQDGFHSLLPACCSRENDLIPYQRVHSTPGLDKAGHGSTQCPNPRVTFTTRTPARVHAALGFQRNFYPFSFNHLFRSSRAAVGPRHRSLRHRRNPRTPTLAGGYQGKQDDSIKSKDMEGCVLQITE